MASNRILLNAPLVEVIAEVHWKLEGTAAGQPYDSNWFALATQVEPALRQRLESVEQLQPAGILAPLVALGRSPVLRFRPSKGGWPLVQVGQGMLSVNAVPPYDGWDAVQELLKWALITGCDASPLLAAVRPERLQLTYRDAFTALHGVPDPRRFFVNQVSAINPEILEAFDASGAERAVPNSLEITARLPGLENTTATVRGALGEVSTADGKRDAAVMDFVIASSASMARLDVDEILRWFDKAHGAAWALFQNLIPDGVMAVLKDRQS